MKRNSETVKVAHMKSRHGKRSKYATKVASGRQMYGPGCCANTNARPSLKVSTRPFNPSFWAGREET